MGELFPVGFFFLGISIFLGILSQLEFLGWVVHHGKEYGRNLGSSLECGVSSQLEPIGETLQFSLFHGNSSVSMGQGVLVCPGTFRRRESGTGSDRARGSHKGRKEGRRRRPQRFPGAAFEVSSPDLVLGLVKAPLSGILETSGAPGTRPLEPLQGLHLERRSSTES